jgi:hypothetical protein
MRGLRERLFHYKPTLEQMKKVLFASPFDLRTERGFLDLAQLEAPALEMHTESDGEEDWSDIDASDAELAKSLCEDAEIAIPAHIKALQQIEVQARMTKFPTKSVVTSEESDTMSDVEYETARQKFVLNAREGFIVNRASMRWPQESEISGEDTDSLASLDIHTSDGTTPNRSRRSSI